MARAAVLRRAAFLVLASAIPLSAQASERGLVLMPEPELLVGLILLFLVLVVPVNLLLFKPIFRVLEERQVRIVGTRMRAEQIERDAADALERYEGQVRTAREEAELERRSVLESARSEALGLLAAARTEVERDLDGARADIDTALEAARATLRGESQLLAREAASRVLGRAV